VFHELSDSIRRLPLEGSEHQQQRVGDRDQLDMSFSTIQPSEDQTNAHNSTLMVPYDQAPSPRNAGSSPYTVRSTAGR
jgi:hypothetical protein